VLGCAAEKVKANKAKTDKIKANKEKVRQQIDKLHRLLLVIKED
jgi:cell division protein FtsB